MTLIDRVQAILLRPRQTWPVVAAESTDVATLYSRYIAILAVIPVDMAALKKGVAGLDLKPLEALERPAK